MVDPFAKPPTKGEITTRVLKNIFLKRMPMNFLFLIIIISLAIFGVSYLKPTESPTGGSIVEVTSEPECPACVCEEQECEQDCDLCPVKTKIEVEEKIYYVCSDGEKVEDKDECVVEFPDVPDDHSGTVEGVTLIIDNIEYEEEDEGEGFVTRVDYTIINKGEFPVVPKIQVKVYEDWSINAKKASPNKVLDPEIVVGTNDYVERKDRVRIYFQGEEQTLRLLLVDALSDPDSDVVAVTRDFSLD
ncbi:MAG: hypothetical protein U9O94_11730 [Nanoarchaeota archaeon]|nr:hypothetical protein [Nanoarchaeota archaeon]